MADPSNSKEKYVDQENENAVSDETDEPEIFRSSDVSGGVSEKVEPLMSGSSETQEFLWTEEMLAWQRTAFHFQPQQNWMNDPNGPFFYNGWYHLFYQYNPNAAVWGDIAWAHAVSKDLINWFHLPLALVPDQWYDQIGVWSGSATILPDGKIVMLYTGGTKDSAQVQNLAYPEDPCDPLLIKWVKYSGNPVLVPPPGVHSTDFRDPTTAWLTSEGKWRITIGVQVDKNGSALVYDTEDFINYELQEGILHGVDKSGMWECVDFYPVSKISGNGLDTSVNGPEVKHVFKISLVDTQYDYYAIGSSDEKNARWYPDNLDVDAATGLRHDCGKFYASKSFYDENKKRRVLWGWIPESDSKDNDIKKGWVSLQSIPRTIVLDTKTGTNLLHWPVEEVESLRLKSHEFDNIEVKPGSVVPLDIGEATQLDIIAEFELDKTVLENSAVSNEEFSCETSKGADHRNALGPFGLLVLADESLAEQTPVYFYVIKGNDGTLETFFCTDQQRSSVANDVSKQIYGNFVPVLEGEKFSLRILVDHSIIESFAQGGRTCITSRVYPTRAIDGGAKLLLFNNATEASVTASLKIWQMDSASIRPYPNLP